MEILQKVKKLQQKNWELEQLRYIEKWMAQNNYQNDKILTKI